MDPFQGPYKMVENRKRKNIDVYLQHINCTFEKQRKLEHRKDHKADTDKINVEQKLTSAFFSDLPARTLIAKYDLQFWGQSCLRRPLRKN